MGNKMSNQDQLNDLSDRIEKMIAYVRDCERRLHAGQSVDLTGLDETTIKLCEEIAALPKDIAKPLADRLEVFVAAIDTMAAVLTVKKD